MALISDLPNATPQKSDLMEIQNGQTSSNNSTVGQLMQLSASENLAPAYDANAGVYEVGDFVIYDGTLYQCNTAIATPEAFDATKWTAVKVTEISSGASVIQLTQAEYTALTTAEKMNGSIYKLTDKAVMLCLDEEYHPVKELTTAQYEALTSAQQNNGTIYIQTDAETTGEDIPVSDSDSATIAEAIEGLSYEDGESGTLATGLWKYRKWADGTLEVWAHQEKSEPLDFAQWGNVYACDPSGIDGTSPVEFTSIDFAIGSVLIRGIVGISSLKSDLSTYTFVRGPLVASGNYPTIKYKYQRGRWKA